MHTRKEPVVELSGRAVLTSARPDGSPAPRPMATRDAIFDGDLWFFTAGDPDTVRRIQSAGTVTMSLSDATSEPRSIIADAEVVRDRAKVAQLWTHALDAWFPDGLQTPGLTLLKLHARPASD